MVLTGKLLRIISTHDHIYFCTYYVHTNMPKLLLHNYMFLSTGLHITAHKLVARLKSFAGHLFR